MGTWCEKVLMTLQLHSGMMSNHYHTESYFPLLLIFIILGHIKNTQNNSTMVCNGHNKVVVILVLTKY